MPSWFERSKFKWNIYTILFMGIELASYQIEYTYGYRIKYWEIGIYILLLLYLKVQFKEPWKDSLINYILCIVLTAGIAGNLLFALCVFISKAGKFCESVGEYSAALRGFCFV